MLFGHVLLGHVAVLQTLRFGLPGDERLPRSVRRVKAFCGLLGLKTNIFADDPDDPYLFRGHLSPDGERWRKYLPGVALNYFFRGDSDREYHNHPWRWSCSVIIGPDGYIEWRKDGRYGPVRRFYLRPGSMNFIWKDTFHRIELVDKTQGIWTLFVMGPRDGKDTEPSNWGFTPEDGSTFEHQADREKRVKRERAEAAKKATPA